MIKRTSWLGKLWGAAAGVLIAAACIAVVAALILGAIRVAQIVVGFVSDILTRTRVTWSWDWFKDLYSTVDATGERHSAAEKITALGAIFTGLFTLILCYVTNVMGRASRRQAAGDAPLLRIDILVDPMPALSTPVTAGQAQVVVKTALPIKKRSGPYPSELAQLDEKLFAENGLQSSPQRLVRVRIQNVQTKPFAVARDIVAILELDSPNIKDPVPDLPEFEPFRPSLRRRRVELELLPPEKFKKKPIFNVGPIGQVQVSVIDVEYRDLRGRRRRVAAYGQMTVAILADGTVEATDGYSPPERWEMP